MRHVAAVYLFSCLDQNLEKSLWLLANTRTRLSNCCNSVKTTVWNALETTVYFKLYASGVRDLRRALTRLKLFHSGPDPYRTLRRAAAWLLTWKPIIGFSRFLLAPSASPPPLKSSYVMSIHHWLNEHDTSRAPAGVGTGSLQLMDSLFLAQWSNCWSLFFGRGIIFNSFKQKHV